jgi:hypothetical protein
VAGVSLLLAQRGINKSMIAIIELGKSTFISPESVPDQLLIR